MRTFVVPGEIAESLGFANTGEEGVGVETPRMEMVAVATPFLPFLSFADRLPHLYSAPWPPLELAINARSPVSLAPSTA